MKDRCPPHSFKAAWASGDENAGVIFCRRCGDIRELNVPSIEPPDKEKVPAAEAEQIRRDYGELT